MRTALTALACLSLSLAAQAATTESYAVLSIGEKIGALTVTSEGRDVAIDWAVDDNGRGAKLKEKVTLGKDGVPVRWDIEGRGAVGAPVKETFAVVGNKATWTTLDDKGEAAPGLYVPNNSSPWTYGVLMKALLVAPQRKRAVLPGGELRLEKLRDVPALGATAYALWGIDVAPTFLLGDRKGRFVGLLSPGWVVIEEKHAARFEELSRLASDLSSEALQKLAKRLTHREPGLVVVKNVRVFQGGAVGAPTNVVVYRGKISAIHGDALPEGAVVVDGEGGTMVPGLHDLHAHQADWFGALHIAAGVTSTRDPGNDNEILLELERRVERGELIGPRVVKYGFLEGRSPHSARDGFVVDNQEDAVARVRWYADRGYRGVKIYNSMTPAWVKPIAAEAHRLGMRVSGHVPAFMTSDAAITDGYDEVNHINQLALSWVIGAKDDTRTPFRFTALGERMAALDLQSAPVQRTLKLMKERGTALDPTLAIFEQMLLTTPGTTSPCDTAWLDHMPVTVQRTRKQAWLDIKPAQIATYAQSYRKLEQLLLMLWKAGVRLVPGTDDMAGFMLHSELESWVRAGIPAAQVLLAATSGSGQHLGTGAGTLTPGSDADLLVVDGDPSKDIAALRKVRFVMKGDAMFYPDEIHEALGIKPFARRLSVATAKTAAR